MPAKKSSSISDDPITFLKSLFDIAVRSAAPANTLASHLPQPPDPTKGRTFVVAAGKAAASMARALETEWPSDAPLSGVALTRYGHACECHRIEVIEAAHPVPDNRGHDAAKRVLAEARALGADDLLLCLISGGGSSLLALPVHGISLEDKKELNRQLLMSGAPIGHMNVLRKHVSAIKGGRLAAAAAPARVVTLAISDVPNDDLSTIASGPTVPDTSTTAKARELVEHYNLDLPDSILQHLANPQAETPKPDHPAFQRAQAIIIAKPEDMLHRLEQLLRERDIAVLSLGADIEGEARTVGTDHGRLARTIAEDTSPPGAHLILSGGETTVTVKPNTQPGQGGRNCEYLLALTIALDGHKGIFAIAADTDGIDGSQTNAGAIVTPDTLKRARALGLDPQAMLNGHDSYTFFEALGDLIVTGPTLTNVNDFRAIWIDKT
ncbi:MAG: glycerate kinase [Pseudomonadota bacterium]